MLQNPCKTLGFKKNMVYKISPGGEVNHIQPVAYSFYLARPPDKSVWLKIIFFISHPKHMLWVLKRTVSMRRFF